MRRSSRKNRMAFWLLVALIQLSTIPLQIYFGWASCIPIGLVLGFIFRNRINRPFLAGFLSLFLQWTAYAFYLDLQNDSLLSLRIARLLSLPESHYYPILITGILGGLLMGSLVLSGCLFGKIIASSSKSEYY